MGTLDTYTSLLRVDTRVAASGLDDLNQSLEKVIQTLNKLELQSSNTGQSLTDKLKGYKNVATEVLDFVVGHAETMRERINTAQSLGIDIGQYDALSRALQTSGSDVKSFNESMTALNGSLKEAAEHGGSDKASAFKAFRISPTDSKGELKSADQMMVELAGVAAKMGRSQASAGLKQLGISDDATIAALMKGSEELERQITLQKTFGVMSQQDVETLDQFARAQGELTSILSRFSDELVLGAAPAMAALINTTIELIAWGKEHQGALLGFFGTLAAVAIPTLTSMAAAAAAASLPFIPLIGAAMLLGLAVDDLWTYFSGGNSVIGGLVQQFPLLGVALNEAKDTVAEAWEALKLLFSDPGAFLDLLVAEFQASWNAIVASVPEAAGQLSEAFLTAWRQMVVEAGVIFSTLWTFVKGLFSHLGDSINSLIQEAINSAIGLLPDVVKNYFGLEIKNAKQPASELGERGSGLLNDHPLLAAGNVASTANYMMWSAAAMPAIPPSSFLTASASNTRSVNVDRVEIHTQATDSQGIADSFADGLKNAWGGLANHYDDGRGY
ncbi:phage tail tape measure protein [Franconibacter daqui]|uniref:phage tail tape measure protein n=1 Tax=Franconibacter daqui TaxID=2047724 RepID=UPI002DB7C1FD|nr:phage tail tape measure protein [Franconibacter daqui]MEB5921435.1 phage tail tape measure protein [Franconibacter daqui]